MSESTSKNSNNEMEIFREMIADEDTAVQIETLRKVHLLASLLGPERTRDELIPCLKECTDLLYDEILYNLAEQMEGFLPLIGGPPYVSLLLDVLIKLSYVDETMVRTKAVQVVRSVCTDLDVKHCEQELYPLVIRLAKSDWFTSKCSACALITTCYAKIASEDMRAELRGFFGVLIEDDSPIVRRSAELGICELVNVVEEKHLISEIVPLFERLYRDDRDTIRAQSIDVGIALAKRFQSLDRVIKTFCAMSTDSSWKVRQMLVEKIHEIQSVSVDKMHSVVCEIYKICAKDTEAEVRITAADNFYNYCVALKKTLTSVDSDQKKFEKFFNDNLLLQLRLFAGDVIDNVRLALSAHLLSLSSVLGSEYFNTYIFPYILNALEHEDSMVFKENILKNLNELPADIEISKSFQSITTVIRNLLEHSRLHWRTRRNILVAFMHIVKNSSSQYFDENLLTFFLRLLSDPIFAIRRTAPLILPLLVTKYGVDWAKNSIISSVLLFHKDRRYLYRQVVLYAIDELVAPTLDIRGNGLKIEAEENAVEEPHYLVGFKGMFKAFQISEPPIQFLRALYRMVYLVELLNKRLENLNDDTEIFENFATPDNIALYAEDTLECLRRNEVRDVFSVDHDEISDDKMSYLEGVLFLLNSDLVGVLESLLTDTNVSVRGRAMYTLKRVREFSQCIAVEQKSDWFQCAMNRVTNELKAEVEQSVGDQLEKKTEIEEAVIEVLEEVKNIVIMETTIEENVDNTNEVEKTESTDETTKVEETNDQPEAD